MSACACFPELIQGHINKGFPVAWHEGDDRVDICRLCGEEAGGRSLYQIQGKWVKCFPRFDPAIGPNKYGMACVPICLACNGSYGFDVMPIDGTNIVVMGFPLHVDNVYRMND